MVRIIIFDLFLTKNEDMLRLLLIASGANRNICSCIEYWFFLILLLSEKMLVRYFIHISTRVPIKEVEQFELRYSFVGLHWAVYLYIQIFIICVCISANRKQFLFLFSISKNQ